MQFIWCYYKRSALGNEIALSIASVKKFYKGDVKITVIGDRPDNYDGHVIPTVRNNVSEHPTYRDVISKLQNASTHPEIDDVFVWMMDDVYFIKEVRPVELLVQRSEPVWNRSEMNTWQKLKTATMDYLASQNLPNIDYATHLPHLLEKDKLARLFQTFPIYDRVFLWENVYGNYYRTPTANYSPFFSRLLVPSTEEQIDFAFNGCSIVNNANKAWNVPLEQWLSKAIGVQYTPASIRPTQLRVVKKEIRGLGDLVETGLKSVGITKHVVRRIKRTVTQNPVADCNCDSRQEWLNNLVPFQ